MNGNRWKKAAGILCLCALLAGLTGCAKKEPLSLTVWTYYNGEQLGAFNEAVEAFNATVGRDKNIVVSASSLGSVNDLEQNVTDAVRGKVGAQEVPDIFSAYADTAYAVDSLGRVADLGPYLTEKDRKEYIESYLSEGDFRGTAALRYSRWRRRRSCSWSTTRIGGRSRRRRARAPTSLRPSKA